MSQFLGSGQQRSWLFTTNEYLACRQLANSRESSSISNTPHTANAEHIYTTLKSSTDGHLTVKLDGISISYVVLEEEEMILRHFCRQIEISISPQEAVSKNHHWRVFATAIVYFRRFYLNNSLAAHDPRVVMLGCILLSSKIEETQGESHIRKVSIGELKQINPKCSEESIITAEMSVMKGINFQSKVFHPQNLCQTIVSDLKRLYSTKSSIKAEGIVAIESIVFDRWLSAAEQLLATLYITSAILSCSPLELTFAALYLTEAGAHAIDHTVAVNKDVITLTFKSEEEKEKDLVSSSTLVKYFTEQFSQQEQSICMLIVPVIASLIERGQNCREGLELTHVKTAMSNLRARSHWPNIIKSEMEINIKKPTLTATALKTTEEISTLTLAVDVKVEPDLSKDEDRARKRIKVEQ